MWSASADDCTAYRVFWEAAVSLKIIHFVDFGYTDTYHISNSKGTYKLEQYITHGVLRTAYIHQLFVFEVD